ncbi:MAG TPA: tetratricopeptide repeat protein [Pirellula sp.]|nr:tetratricopeptide repeat protein [Pirellula sp.]
MKLFTANRFIFATSMLFVLLSCFGSSGCTRMTQNGTGVSLYQQGRYAEALQTFEQAKQTDPSNPDSYYNLASTYHRLGTSAKDQKMLDNAEAIYNQALELSPNHVECHRALAVLLVETGRSDKAFTLLKRWAQRSPSVSDARVELAKLHQEFNQTKIAEQYLDEALAMDPNNAKAWAERGRLRENSGELMQAVQNYQQSIAINSLQPDLYQRIGALNVRLTQNVMSTTGTTIAGATGAPGNSAPKSVSSATSTLNASAPSPTNSASNFAIPPVQNRY